MLKDCQECENFYTCDNMGWFEECLPKQTYFEPRTEEELEEEGEE